MYMHATIKQTLTGSNSNHQPPIGRKQEARHAISFAFSLSFSLTLSIHAYILIVLLRRNMQKDDAWMITTFFKQKFINSEFVSRDISAHIQRKNKHTFVI